MARKKKSFKPAINTSITKDLGNRENRPTDIYIPKHFLAYTPCFLLCALSRNYSHRKINAIYATCNVKHLLKLMNKAQSVFPRNIEICVGVVGGENLPASLCNDNNFVINVTSGYLYVESVFFNDVQFIATHFVTLVTYKSHEILDCELLECQEEIETDNSLDRMIDFLNYTFKLTKRINSRLINDMSWKQIRCNDVMSCVDISAGYLKCVFLYITLIALHPFRNIPTEKLKPPIRKAVNVTATGRQILRKIKEIKNLHNCLQSKDLSLKCGNLMSALIFDAIFGIALTYVLRDYLNPEEMFAYILELTETVVNQLQILLNWLMGVPAGLKLNRPLNIVLGRFFLYHIYLWKTYIVVLKPFLLIALENLTLVGVFGVSFLLSFASDFISLATIHIYCFYGYAAKLYYFNVTGLVALWRLFCGKKWNPLRNRVDSYTYDVQQLFIGTLIFTVLIFLLPTVVVYYVVFTLLRVVVLTFQLGIAKMVQHINTMPIYVLYLRLISHQYIKGDIYFQVVSNVQKTVHLYMEPKPSSWFTLLSKTRPETPECNPVTWSEIGYNLLRGNIIYPL